MAQERMAQGILPYHRAISRLPGMTLPWRLGLVRKSLTHIGGQDPYFRISDAVRIGPSRLTENDLRDRRLDQSGITAFDVDAIRDAQGARQTLAQILKRTFTRSGHLDAATPSAHFFIPRTDERQT